VAVPEFSDGLLLGILTVACLLPWLFWNIQPYPFAPIYYTSILLLLVYPIRAFVVLVFPEMALGISTFYTPPYDPLTVKQALFSVILGVLTYQIFYYCLHSITRLKLRALHPETPYSGWQSKLLLIYLVGWLFRIYQINTGNFTSWLPGENFDPTTFTLLTYFSELCEIAYILVWIFALKEQKCSALTYLLLGSLIISELVFGLTVQGTKTKLVRLGLFPIMAYSLVKCRVPWKTLAIASCIAVGFLFPFVHAYRDIYTERFGESFQFSAEDGLVTSVEAIGGMFDQSGHYSTSISDDAPVLALGLAILLNRLHGFDSLVVALENFPRPFSYMKGEDLITAPIALIPRAIWPDKPVSQSSDIFDVQILESPLARSSTFPVAEGYMNGGWSGVVLVMLSVAALQWALFSLFYFPNKNDTLIVGAYIWFFIWVVDIGTWVLPAYTYLTQRILVFTIVWVMFRHTSLAFQCDVRRQAKACS
jgi:hypothetical protein